MNPYAWQQSPSHVLNKVAGGSETDSQLRQLRDKELSKRPTLFT
jgi:hypothetical protein